jgi:hypothetical protein
MTQGAENHRRTQGWQRSSKEVRPTSSGRDAGAFATNKAKNRLPIFFIIHPQNHILHVGANGCSPEEWEARFFCKQPLG